MSGGVLDATAATERTDTTKVPAGVRPLADARGFIRTFVVFPAGGLGPDECRAVAGVLDTGT